MDETREIRTTCNICHIGCGVIVYLHEGNIMKIEGDPGSPLNKGTLCPKGDASLEYLNHPERLRRPLKKVGKKGIGTWSTIDWEEASNIVAERLNALKNQYGPESVAFMRGAAKGLQDDYLTRFANLFGSPNITSMAHVCFMPRRNASIMTYGYYAIPDLDYPPRCIIVWGLNSPETLQFEYHRLIKAKENGARIIVVDPHRNGVTDIADLWIQLKPGSDIALALAMLNVIIDDSLYDKDFVERFTLGFGELKSHIQDYTPERVADLAWVSPDTIRQAARLFASHKPGCIQWGNGIDHNTNNFQTARAICLIRAITGNLGVPGGELQWLPPPLVGRGSPEFTLQDKIPVEVRKKKIIGDNSLLPMNFYALPQSIIEAIVTGKPYPVKGAFIQGGNLLSSYPNARKVYQALQDLEFLVVSDRFMTPTAALADIVLPVTTYLEFNSIVSPPYSLAVAIAQRKVVNMDDCRSDYEILRDIARRMGFGEYFWDTEEECLDFLLKPAGVTFEEFKKIGVLYGSKQYRPFLQKGFSTPSGKVELYSQRLKESGFDPLPSYHELNEEPDDEDGATTNFPLILINWKSKLFRHSEGKQISLLRGAHPEPICVIHPETGHQLGIHEGDQVYIETRTGRTRQKACLNTSVDPRVVGVDYGWWFPEKGQSASYGWDESNVNTIIDDGPPYGREMGTPRLRGVPCRIYKVA
jgi:anaerobic selenocysteine-containing dehydrogenase